MVNLVESLLEEERPRELLVRNGAATLNDVQLLAIILRTGSRGQNVIDLARSLLTHFGGLHEVRNASLEELRQVHGVGYVKAVDIQATLELGKRLNMAKQPKDGRVRSSADLAYSLMEELRGKHQEHLLCLYLNTKNEIIKKETLFIGSLNQSIAHPREIFRGAVRYSAARLIIAHNHPSGNPKPSENDLLFTERLKECGEMMGIELLDHLIIGSERYISLREEGFWN